jgi:uncharacterized membrane protein HdeD (DUF308 family)
MSNETEKTVTSTSEVGLVASGTQLQRELGHLKSNWRWVIAWGYFLVICGAIAVIFPVIPSVAAVGVLGVILLVGGVTMIIGSFWAGKWSGFLIQLLTGILYIIAGIAITDNPLLSLKLLTFCLAVSFIVLGLFRTIGALVIRFPLWGWTLLNGVITFLCGTVIIRHLSEDAIWVIGLLIGLEMLFNGWAWIMLAIKIRELPDVTGK